MLKAFQAFREKSKTFIRDFYTGIEIELEMCEKFELFEGDREGVKGGIG